LLVTTMQRNRKASLEIPEVGLAVWRFGERGASMITGLPEETLRRLFKTAERSSGNAKEEPNGDACCGVMIGNVAEETGDGGY
jgi:C4-type Zn-finger protein